MSTEEDRITYTYQPTRLDGKPYKRPPKPVTRCLYVCDDGDYIDSARPATEEDLADFGFVRVQESQDADADEARHPVQGNEDGVGLGSGRPAIDVDV